MKRHNIKEEHIDRRDFLKGVGALGISSIFPLSLRSAGLDYESIAFDSGVYERNDAQTIIVYLYGGPSELAGNMTNIEAISQMSQNPYPLDDERYIKLTKDDFWGNAGGYAMQRMLESGDMNLFRTCYRTVDDTKAHGECTSQAQRGKETAGGAGIVANLASILYHKGVVSEPSGTDDIGKSIPFVTMEGESTFFTEDELNLDPFLKPVAFGSGSDNPYRRGGGYERHLLNRETNTTLGSYFDSLSQRYSREGKIKESFERRVTLEKFANEINEIELPEGIDYPENNVFGSRLKTAMNLLIHNEHTKVVSMGSPGLGGWDDHSNAIDRYTRRMTDLMEAIETAMAHMKAVGKSNINIVVFGEFGRNVNYNNSLGWDHGNNQNVYWFGGGDYMNRLGIVGETEVTGSGTRLYTRPKNFGTSGASYHFQVFSVAATIYRLYGIQNPEILTNGNSVIRDLLS
ncbi:hypothetical protein HCR_00280 [Hydrogenimonas cancrithermarum]|uniref:DUF1501 domain-containing protein n=2 Tax=Hydrogenimonas cancrithermarum TaxID=2993563 RepID=A0ABM8FK50_9BACT|nr:hypothetical protein HCR_00280 [Hydrogenimonas cancrithermarum]